MGLPVIEKTAVFGMMRNRVVSLVNHVGIGNGAQLSAIESRW